MLLIRNEITVYGFFYYMWNSVSIRYWTKKVGISWALLEKDKKPGYKSFLSAFSSVETMCLGYMPPQMSMKGKAYRELKAIKLLLMSSWFKIKTCPWKNITNYFANKLLCFEMMLREQCRKQSKISIHVFWYTSIFFLQDGKCEHMYCQVSRIDFPLNHILFC